MRLFPSMKPVPPAETPPQFRDAFECAESLLFQVAKGEAVDPDLAGGVASLIQLQERHSTRVQKRLVELARGHHLILWLNGSEKPEVAMMERDVNGYHLDNLHHCAGWTFPHCSGGPTDPYLDRLYPKQNTRVVPITLEQMRALIKAGLLFPINAKYNTILGINVRDA